MLSAESLRLVYHQSDVMCCKRLGRGECSSSSSSFKLSVALLLCHRRCIHHFCGTSGGCSNFSTLELSAGSNRSSLFPASTTTTGQLPPVKSLSWPELLPLDQWINSPTYFLIARRVRWWPSRSEYRLANGVRCAYRLLS